MYTKIRAIKVLTWGPNTQATNKPKTAVNNSTSGYRELIFMLQKAHLPRNKK